MPRCRNHGDDQQVRDGNGAHTIRVHPSVFQRERKKEKRIEKGNDIRLRSLATLGRLQDQCLLLQYRRIAIHEMRERPEIILVQQCNGQFGLE